LPTRAQSVAASPDGRTIAVSENNGRTGLFDASTGRLVWQVPAIHQANPVSMTYAPDGHTLVLFAAALGGGLAVVVDTRTDKVLAAARDGRKGGSLTSAAVSPNGRPLAAVSIQQLGKLTHHHPQLWRWSLPDLQPIGQPVKLPPQTRIIGFIGAN